LIKQATNPSRLLSRTALCRLKIAVLLSPVALFLPLFHVSHVSAHAQVKRDIRSVDFRNFTFPVACGERKTLTLRQGKVPGEGCNDITKLVSVRYRDLNGDGLEEAIIAIGTNCIVSCWYIEDYLVYSYRKGRLKVLFKEEQGYRYGLVEPVDYANEVRGLRRPYGLSIKGRRLLITALAWEKGDGNCCPRYRESTLYEWRRNRFAVVWRKRKYDPNGPGDPWTRQ
jgi:hypothetical protein